MWVNWTHTPRLNIAAHGSTSVTCPSTRRNPEGVFIQAFTEMMQNVPTTPETAIGTSVSRCSRSAADGPSRTGRCR